MSSPIRFAVIGYGHIGRRHAHLIAAHPEACVVAVIDVNAQRLAEAARELRNDDGECEADPPRTLGSLAELLAGDLTFDVACICTPNGLHADQAVRVLDSGRDVVIEKPIALTVADCDRIIAAAGTTRRVFGVMQNRYSPASAWLKSVLEAERLGRLLQVHLDCYWNRDERYYRLPDGRPHPWHGDPALDGGVLFTQFAHFIDLLCWGFGEPDILGGYRINQTHADLHPFTDGGMIHYRLPGGAIGSLNFSTAIYDRNFESTLTVIGERGTVKLGGQYMNELRYCHVAGLTPPDLPPSNAANNYGPYSGSAANHHFVIDNVIDVLNGRAEIATTARQGRAVVRTIVAAQALSELPAS